MKHYVLTTEYGNQVFPTKVRLYYNKEGLH